MNNIRKTTSGFLVFGILATFSLFGGFAKNQTTSPNLIRKSLPSAARERSLSAADFNGEAEADSQELGVSISQSTVTGTSQSLTIAFRSKTLAGYRTAIGNYIVGIDDPNFTGDDSNPAPEGYDKYDETTGLPLFNGYVAYIVGSSSASNQKIYLPDTLTRAGSFTVHISYIATGCISADGHEYQDMNNWDRVTDIYIPNSIEEVQTGAFTGTPTDGSVVIHYEGTSLPANVFAPGWIDADTTDPTIFDISQNSYDRPASRNANIGGKVELPDPLGRPLNFILGCKRDGSNPKFDDPKFDKPLIIQYDLYKDGVKQETVYEELPLTNTVGNPYDSCGPISSNSYTRTLGYKLKPGESIDDESIVFHNIMKADVDENIDTDHTYYVKPIIGYSDKQTIDNLVHVRPSTNSTFAGYSMFTLKMDKNLSITSERYPQPHSLYLDVKTDIYEQNITNIKSGKTKIRYSLYNLYNSSYHFQYIGSGNVLKDIEIPVKSVISYQTLDNNSDNLVSVLLKNSDVAADFSAEKVRLFELKNITIQMDLMTISDSGSTSILGKSSISYKFAYITVIDSKGPITVFDWNLFLIIFLGAYVVLYVAGAYGLYRFMKEKFKNDEFRRVNDKKYLKQAIIGGFGLGIVLYAALFLIMRTSGFKNTIVVFNPTDPLLIAFAIVALIIIGYFIVHVVKLIKAEKERRKAIRLKLNEDVEDDGTN